MSVASEKLVQAENAGSKAKKTAEDWNLNENAEPVAEKIEPDPASLAPGGDSTIEKK